MSTAIVGVIWPLTGGVQQLETLAGYLDPAAFRGTIPLAASLDGSVVVGWASDASGTHAVRWDGTTLSALATITGVEAAWDCSDDAGIIIGASVDGANLARWTAGGTAGALLSPDASCSGVAAASARRLCSDDGVVIIGQVSPNTVTSWTNAVATSVDTGSATGISGDGTLISGAQYPGGPSINGFWRGGTFHRLANLGSGAGATSPGTILFSDAAGTVIYGNLLDTDATPAYWDSLATSATISGTTYWGVCHTMDLPESLPDIHDVARNANVAVGSTPTHGAPGAVRWNATVAANLPGVAGLTVRAALFVSGDGAIAVGWCDDAVIGSQPVYWDAGNALHALPMPVGATNGQPTGVSKDGSLIFGYVTIETDPPDPDPIPEEAVYPDPPAVFLSWSDDRGHSFGNPVGISLGAIGEYVTSLQWQRLGLGRSRVFQLEWSSPVRTVLLGAWIDRTPAQT